MQALNKHIAILFLGGFLFPQVAGSMHYFVVSHNFSAEKDNSYSTPEPDSLFHSCLYHITGFSDGILPQNIPDLSNNFPPRGTFSFCNIKNYVQRDDFNFLLRGPPMEHLLSEFMGLNSPNNYLLNKKIKNENQISLFI